MPNANSIQGSTVNSVPPSQELRASGSGTPMPIAAQIAAADGSDSQFVTPIEPAGERQNVLSRERKLVDDGARETHRSVFDDVEKLYAARQNGLSKLGENLRVIDAAEKKALDALFDHAPDSAALHALYKAGQLTARYGVADIAVAISELRHSGEKPEVCDALAKKLCKLVLADKLGERSGFSAFYNDNTYDRVQRLIQKINDKFSALPDQKDIFASVLEREVMPAIRDYIRDRLGEPDPETWQKIDGANGLASRAAAKAAERMTEKLKTFERDGSHIALHARVNQWRIAQHWAELMRATKLPQPKENDSSAAATRPPRPTAIPVPESVPVSAAIPVSAQVPYSGISNIGNPNIVICNGDGRYGEETVLEILKQINAGKATGSASLPVQLQQALSSRATRPEGRFATQDGHGSAVRFISPYSRSRQDSIDSVSLTSTHIYDNVPNDDILGRNNETHTDRFENLNSDNEDSTSVSEWTDRSNSDVESDIRGAAFRTVTAQIHPVPGQSRFSNSASISELEESLDPALASGIGNPIDQDELALADAVVNQPLVSETTLTAGENRVLPFPEDAARSHDHSRLHKENTQSPQAATELPVSDEMASHSTTPDTVRFGVNFPSLTDTIEKLNGERGKFNGRVQIRSSELSSSQIGSLQNASVRRELASLNRQSSHLSSASDGSLNEVSGGRRPLSTTSRPDQIQPSSVFRRLGGRS